MSISGKQVSIEEAVVEHGLLIIDVRCYQRQGLFIVVLNTGFVFQQALSDYKLLANANQQQLSNNRLIGGGVGIHWPDLDEDISLNGLLKNHLRFIGSPSYAMSA